VTNSASQVTDNSIVADDTGREIVSATVGGSSVSIGTPAYTTAFGTSAVFVGEVTQNGPAFPTTSGGSTLLGGSFQLIDDNGNPITPTGAVTSVTLSGECDPATSSGLASTCSGNQTPDPLFDATDATAGGGDTGSVLISPFITPGTSSTVEYNHYSWLRTVEDLFDVSNCSGTANDVTLAAGSVCGGLDSSGHLGYAAQVNLADFGSDVFSAPSGNGFQQLQPPAQTPESPLTVGLPICGLAIIGGAMLLRRRRNKVTATL
jgi:hypothetical protein